ncbi:Hypothetical predicted protein [Cloeon dipterum]|uniref:Uncharacterized protein n=1 Tax=Cloeon dipterum TaxID=197152 RepID=A0A8S1DDZ9_9INSE|nr:Hypothetical predicted protein [Cloeon dipterum]
MEAREENSPQEHNKVFLRTICIPSCCRPESNTPSEEIREVVSPQPSGQPLHAPSDQPPQREQSSITLPGLPSDLPPGHSSQFQPELQHDVSKCVYCDTDLEIFDERLDEEELKMIPYLCPKHFSRGMPNKKHLKEPQDATKICLVCTVNFRVFTRMCHFTVCDPGQHDDPYCEICVKSMEEAERVEHVSPSGARNLYQADDEGDDPKTSWWIKAWAKAKGLYN